jgi:uncharacterized protein YjiS (DUF1127 family)
MNAIALTTLRSSASRRPLAALWRLVAQWRARSQERRWLAAMSDRELQDLRLTRFEALAEAGKPFWRA